MLVNKLKAWLEDATSANPSNYVRYHGICFYTKEYAMIGAITGLDYPFGAGDYFLRARKGTMHLCPKRLAWARQYIKDHDHVQD